MDERLCWVCLEQDKIKSETDFDNPITQEFIAWFLTMVGHKMGVLHFPPTGPQVPDHICSVMSRFAADPELCEAILPDRAESMSWKDLRPLSECQPKPVQPQSLFSQLIQNRF